jgi:enolase
MSARISDVDAWEVLDSRGSPTIRVRVILNDGRSAIACAPSGASTGRNEARELRDGDLRYGGRGVMHAVVAAKTLAPIALRGCDPTDQTTCDAALIAADATPDRSHLGANALVAVSMAVARCGALVRDLPLYLHLGGSADPHMPVPLMNVLNGGAHASGGLRIQECMIVPHGPKSVAERVRCGAEIYAALRCVMLDDGYATSLGDEGGFVFGGTSLDEAVDAINAAIKAAGYALGADVSLGLDPAANGFKKSDGTYEPEPNLRLSSSSLIDWWEGVIARHPVIFLEDPLAEDDWQGWVEITSRLGDRVTLVGDDIFVTNPEIIGRAVKEGVANCALLKPNQVGTVSETLEAAKVARDAGYKIVVSHRSGETCDTFIADLAVALSADYLKAGAPARSERTEKYNRLLEIEHEASALTSKQGVRDQ